MAPPEGWQVAVAQQLGVPVGRVGWRSLGGSALIATWRLDASGEVWFVKLNRADRLPMLEAEAAGLAELAATQAVRVARPLACGRAFYAAYEDASWPLPPGSARRRLYNLYHVLNHGNLFGGGYLVQARRMIGEVLAGT